MGLIGREKWVAEKNPLKRAAYFLLGEVHVPGRLRVRHVLKAIKRQGLADRKIHFVDAGSGRGDLLLYVARRFPHWTCTGIELDPERLAISRDTAKHFNVTNARFFQSRLEELPLKDEADFVVCTDVLEHIEDDVTVLERLFGACKPGGQVLITSPSIPQRKHLWLVKQREDKIGFTPADYGHVRDGYSCADIEEKFRRTGGIPEECRQTYGFFGTLAFDIFFVIGDNRPNPMVFFLLFPFMMMLSELDLLFPIRHGSAVLAIARKA